MSVITMIPRKHSGNAYTILLYRALESVGIAYRQIPYSLPYMLTHKRLDRFHYLHFHWPENFFDFRPRQPHKFFGLKGFFRIKLFWLLAKLRGYKIIWTVHEVDVHDLERHRWIYNFSRRLLWKLADIVFSHTPEVMSEATRRWGHKKHAHTIPIGSYEGAYACDISRRDARERLGVPQGAFAFVFFGNIQPFKGIDALIAATRALQARHPECHVLIAGRPNSDAYADSLRAQAADLPQVHLSIGYVPDDDVQLYMRAADCFVAPYRYIETCSAIYLALAFELPIIITADGNVVEFTEHAIGIFMRDSNETQSAMQRMLEMPANELATLRENTRAASRLYSWETLRHRYREAFDHFEGGTPSAALDSAAPPRSAANDNANDNIEQRS